MERFSPHAAKPPSGLANCAASALRFSSSRPAAPGKNRSKFASRLTAASRCIQWLGPSGQGHETVFPLLVAKILGFAEDKIALRYNDTAAPKLVGVGTFGSRSLISHGAALTTAAHQMVEKGRQLAADELEVAASDIVFAQWPIQRRRHRPDHQHTDIDRKKVGGADAPAHHEHHNRSRHGLSERRAYCGSRNRSGHGISVDRQLYRRRRLRHRL